MMSANISNSTVVTYFNQTFPHLKLINSTLQQLNQTASASSAEGWAFSVATFEVWALLGLPLQLFLVAAIVTNKELRKPIDWLITNALIGDAAFLAAFALPNAVFTHADYANRGPGCAITGFLIYSLSGVPQITCPYIGLNRYYAFCHRHVVDDVFSKRNAALMIASTWIIGAIFAIPHAVMGNYGFEDKELRMCGTELDGDPVKLGYMLVDLLGVVAIPYAITTYCNIKIYRKLQAHRVLLKSSAIRKPGMAERDASFEGVMMLLIHYCVLPALLQTPAAVIKLVPAIGQNEWLVRVALAIYLLAHVISPYLILHCLAPYRKAARMLLEKRFGLRPSSKVGPSGAVIMVKPATSCTDTNAGPT